MAKRLIRFALYAVFFPLIPFLLTCFLHVASPSLHVAEILLSPELLVFAIALNAVGQASLSDVTDAKQRDVAVESLRSVHIVGLVVAALLYGAHAYARDVTQDRGTFVVALFWLSALLGLVSLAVAIGTEVLIGTIKGEH